MFIILLNEGEFVMSLDEFKDGEFNKANEQRSFKGDAAEAAFLLGGIGTGNISVGARGELRDWEIFNKPAKGNLSPYSFFCIRTKTDEGVIEAKILESEIKPPFRRAHGYHSMETAGLPRFKASSMSGEYPFVSVEFEDDEMPVKVVFEAFTPFIPLNADDSGIPGAILRYRVKNITSLDVDVTIVGSLANLSGFSGYDVFENMLVPEGLVNDYREEELIKGIHFTSSKLQSHQLKYGDMSILTADENTMAKPSWLKGNWWDGVQDFWNVFCSEGKVDFEASQEASESRIGPSAPKVGSLGINHNLKPGEEKVFEFVIAWYFPNRVKSWFEDKEALEGFIEKNYYSTLFKDSWTAGKYIINNIESLEKGSRDFHRALFTSTLPAYVIDALASNITVIRSTTCFRIEDGTFLAFEGSHDTMGSCEGTCTHVWNYAQTLAFLFPELEKTSREVEFNIETDEAGSMAFRNWQIFGRPRFNLLPAADGQMGTIIRLYREWKLTGDDEFLRRVWEKAAKALDFAFSYWDSDGDFVLDSQQHNTYDIEFYGPNSLTNSMFFAALKAGIEMAEYVGDSFHKEKYRNALEKGSRSMDEFLWGGEYYIQKLEDVNKYKYQYGIGCLSDQLLGQFLAHVCGLGYILPEEHVKKALMSIYKYNFCRDFRKVHNVQRTYVLNDESGLLLCSWPKGGRPRLPFVYSDEVWTGVEYQVAAHLIFEGFIEEGLNIVKTVRERQDGYRRNPWNEVECGNHYARSLSSWALLIALSGFKFDMTRDEISFKPVINEEDFSSFWSTGKEWGIYSQKLNLQNNKIESNTEVLYKA
jgi:non-lysosomal glucosylceramidase